MLIGEVQYYSDPPTTTVHPKLTGMSGTFALPMPRAGCSDGLSRGWVKGDTYNLINDDLKYPNHIKTYFCVKTEENLD